MMVVYSPIIGGACSASADRGRTFLRNPLYLDSSLKYIVMTLVLHLVYGLLNGWLIPRWVERPRTGEAA